MSNYNSIVDALSVLSLLIVSMPLVGLVLYISITRLTADNLGIFYKSLMASWFKLP